MKSRLPSISTTLFARLQRGALALGNEAAATRSFLLNHINPDGGFQGRNGPSDLYYTAFGIDLLLAASPSLPPTRGACCTTPHPPSPNSHSSRPLRLCENPLPSHLPLTIHHSPLTIPPSLSSYLLQFGTGDSLGFMDLVSLARARMRLMPDQTPPAWRQTLANHLSRFRTANGGYNIEPGAAMASATATFIAWIAFESLGILPDAPDLIPASLRPLATPDGAYSNLPDMPVGNTPSTAAAQVLLHHLSSAIPHSPSTIPHSPPPFASFAPSREPSPSPWLLSQLDDSGGFRAFPEAPIPDLLSTGTALFALSYLSSHSPNPPSPSTMPHQPFTTHHSPFTSSSLHSFIASLRGPTGGYTGHGFDTVEDVEYTYYALLALGSLSFIDSQKSTPFAFLAPSREPSPLPPPPPHQPPARNAAPSAAGGSTIHHSPFTTHAPSPPSLTLSSLESTLLASFNPDRPWTGHLSDSAVSTAIASFALHTVDPTAHRQAINAGIAWLLRTRNPDGGWGDSPDSPSNITATLLTHFALHATSTPPFAPLASLREPFPFPPLIPPSPFPLHSPASIAQALRDRYGNDKTFPAPILTMGALSGYLGPSPAAWAIVPQLPFELAACPTRWFRLLNIGVVSYALPALIAIGLVRHKHLPSRLTPLRKLRDHLTPRLLDIACAMQPSNGGYEEATPLTGFVTMSLAAAGFRDHPIVQRGVSFLLSSQRPDGAWPIDTDLATWVTAQSVVALTEPGAEPILSPDRQAIIRRWLLAQQHTTIHPLTGGAPGGWGWTNLPGAMPDADDTAGVLIALHRLGPPTPATRAAVSGGIQWLLNLQNHDGGIPTFCRGWGKLPFDRSCPDLTAHTLEAFAVWQPVLPPADRNRVTRSLARMLRYLEKSQSRDGAWLPLWFGTQTTCDEANPVYGTARTVLALARALPFIGKDLTPSLSPLLEKGRTYLLHAQHPEGGWAAQPDLPPSIEETAMALAAMTGSGHQASIERGTKALLDLTSNGTHLPPSPMGLYFARLWYSEQLYPAIFSITALRRVMANRATIVP